MSDWRPPDQSDQVDEELLPASEPLPPSEPAPPDDVSPEVASPAPPAPDSVAPPVDLDTPPAPLPAPVHPAKPKMNVLFFVLGFFAPVLVGALLILIANWAPPVAGFGTLLYPAGLIALVIALLQGRSKGNARLRSFGLGGLWAYGVSALAGLLLFGACFISLAGSNSPL